MECNVVRNGIIEETVGISITLSSSGNTNKMYASYFDPEENDTKTISIPVTSTVQFKTLKNSPVAFYNLNNDSTFEYMPRIYSSSPSSSWRRIKTNNSSNLDDRGVSLYCFDSDSTLNVSIMCMIAGTLIALFDGTTKKIEDITYDDDLLVWDFFNGCFTSAKPRWIKIKQTSPVYNKLTFSDGTILGLVGEGNDQGYHRIFNKQAGLFTHTGVPETPIGTITFSQDKTEPVLIKQELVYDNVDFYNIITDKHFNLFANGILTSCKCSNMYKIKNMKYIGKRLLSDKEIEEDFEWRKLIQRP